MDRPKRKRIVRDESFVVRAMAAWGPSVWRVALMNTPTRSDAEEVFQDVFLSLACDDTSFTDDAHVKAWLLRVALNRCRDVVRRHRHGEALTFGEDVPEAVDWRTPEDEVLRSDEMRRLVQAIQSLPEKQRAVVFLHYGEGLSCEEVARVLGIGPSAVKMRLKRARAKLESQLGGAADGKARGDSSGVGALHTA